MQKNKIIRFLHSLALLPILAVSPFSSSLSKIQPALYIGLPENTPIVLGEKKNTKAEVPPVLNQEADILAKTIEIRGKAIDAYFRAFDMPLFGTGQLFAEAAEKYKLDWRLLPAIAVRESTGGKFACKGEKFNPFGWASCKVGFSSYQEAIDTVAKNLAGRNSATAKYYLGKDTKGILLAYNPPSIVPKYSSQVMYIMKQIGSEDLVYTEEA